MTRVGWLDCAAGAAGDMLLAAALDAGAPRAAVDAAVAALGVPATLTVERVDAGGLRATRVHVGTDEPDPPKRTWAEVREIVQAAALDERVRVLALDAFRRLAEAEGRVHGVLPGEVHFHEVGAHDAIVDVVGTAAAVTALGLAEVRVSPVALGGGWARAGHGLVPVPGPAVLEILAAAGAPAHGGPEEVELCTPTGAALVTALAAGWGPLPAMSVTAVGIGAGTRPLPGRPNVVRLVVGDRAGERGGAAAEAEQPRGEEALLVEANVDDLDPRLWPGVLERLLAAGAVDAWLVPILMKKGRPAHTVCALVDGPRAAQVRRTLFAETSTIGLRETTVAKRALARETRTVEVGGHAVRVKLATLGGVEVSATPEFEDVAAAARAGGRPVKAVLADAVAAARAAGMGP